MKFKEHKDWKKIVAKYLNKLKHDYSVYQDVTNDLGSLEVPDLSVEEIKRIIIAYLLPIAIKKGKAIDVDVDNIVHAIVKAREGKRR